MKQLILHYRGGGWFKRLWKSNRVVCSFENFALEMNSLVFTSAACNSTQNDDNVSKIVKPNVPSHNRNS